MSEHLSDDVLERLEIGDLSESDAAGARRHLAACPDCRARNDELRDANRDFLDDVRRLAKPGANDETLQSPRADGAAPQGGSDEPPRVVIPGYSITRRIGGGGQGIVYQAIQESTRRKVAIKVLRGPSAASDAARERFRREVELIAQLKHPNIIAIFDSGVTADGMPFYVMDYVRGEPLNHYVRDHTISLQVALHIFSQVCQAVHFAHEKGVIHRDLKPSNILVSPEGHPVVLDFGLAKSLAAPSGPNLSLTHEVMGTLPYMAPEQVLSNASEVDKRTDVYALGVVLYELLTGHYPYVVSDNLAQAIKAITEAPPAPPSRRWTPDTGISTAAARRGTRRGGRCPIDKEIEAIVLKALSKERERRYSTAEAFGEDVARYLSGDDIIARPPSLVYRVRQHIRRHRQGAIAWSISGVIAIAALIVAFQYGNSASNAKRAEDLAHQKVDLARQAENITSQAEHLLEAQGKAKPFEEQSESERFEANKQLEEIERLVNEAIDKSSNYAKAYYRRGELEVLRALRAPIGDKRRHIDAALRDFEAAHVKAGGVSFDNISQQGLMNIGHPPALWEAIDLLALRGGDDKHGFRPGTPDIALAAELLNAVQGALQPLTALEMQKTFGRPIRLRGETSNDMTLLEQSPELAAMTPRPNGEITILFRNPARIAFSGNQKGRSPTPYILDLIFDRLYLERMNRSYQWNDALLKEGPIQKDKKTWTFTLSAAATWHDGTPVTAADVEFSWYRVYRNDFDEIESIEVNNLEPRTFSIRLKRAWTSPECEMLFRILPQHVFADLLADKSPSELLSEKDTENFIKNPIGSGPYHVISSTQSSGDKYPKWILERFDGYSGTIQPLLSRIQILGHDDVNERIRHIVQDKVDVVELSFDDYRWNMCGKSFAGYRKVKSPQIAYEYFLWTPSSRSRFSREFREAVVQAIDIDAIRRQEQDNIFDRFEGIWGGWGYTSEHDVFSYSYRPEEAERLLNKEGWVVSNGAFRMKDGELLRLTLEIDKTSTFSVRRVVARVKQYLARVGIDLEIVAVERPGTPSSASVSSGPTAPSTAGAAADLAYKVVIQDPNPLRDRRRWTPPPEDSSDWRSNDSQYGSSPEFGESVAKEFIRARGAELSERRDILLKIQSQIYRDQPYVFLWQRPAMWLFRDNIRGVQFGPTGPLGVYPGIRAWWVPQ